MVSEAVNIRLAQDAQETADRSVQEVTDNINAQRALACEALVLGCDITL